MVSFERDIRPLIRIIDRDEMLWALDLYDLEDVKRNSTAILLRLECGEMPCDGGWDVKNVATFRSWMEGGMQP